MSELFDKLTSDSVKAVVVTSGGGGGGTGGGTTSTFQDSFPLDGTAVGFKDSAGNMGSARIYDVNTGAGVETVIGVSLRQSGSTGSVELGTNTAPIRVDPTGATTQPVNITNSSIASSQSGIWDIGTVSTITSISNVVHIDDNGGSITVDGSVSATQAGTWNIATLTSITNVVHVDDNGGSLTVDGAITANQGGAWNITNISGTISLPTGAATETTLGNILTTSAFQARINTLGQKGMAGSSPVVIASDQSGVAVTQSGNWVVDSNITNSVLHIDDNGSSLTVDGTVNSAQSGNWNVGITDGFNTATVRSLTNSKALNVSIVDANGDQITSFSGAGGGTTSTVTATQSGIWTIDSITQVVHVDDNSGSLTVDGSVTVTQATGTNLHTVVDSGTITVSQAAGSNLHTVVDSGTITAVTSITNALPAGSNVIGHVIVDSAPTTAVTNAGLSNLDVALSTRLKPADTLAAVTTIGSITNVVHVDDNSGSLTVDGTVTVQQTTGSNLHTVLDSGTLTGITNVVHIDDNSGSLTVDNNGTFAVQATLQTGTNQIGHLEPNQSVNLTMVSGLNVDLGTGVAGTGTLRVAVSSDSFPTTQAISGTITANQGTTGAQAWKVDGSAVTQPVSGSISVSNFPATQPVSGTVTVQQSTGTSLHSVIDSGTITTITNPIGVSGNVTVVQGTGTNLHTVIDSGAVTVSQATGSNLHTVLDSGTLTTITNVVHVDDNSGSLTVDNAGTFAVQATLQIGSNQIGHLEPNQSVNLTMVSGQNTDVGIGVSGLGTQRVAVSSDSSINAVQNGTWNIGTVTTLTGITNALPAGTNVIGHVIVDSAPTTAVTNAGLSNLDVALSTRLKPADTLTAVTTVGTITNPVTVSQATGTNLHTVIDSGTITAVTAITNALPAGSNVIGHIIADSGSTTAVTGNVTVVQPTGTNLHAVLDTGSTTTVTQATGTNLHTVIDSGTITAVTAITNALPVGSNVIGHVIADSGSTTAVTGNVTVVQPTISSLNAQVAGTVASGTTDADNPVKVGGKYNTSQPTFSNGQRGDLQIDSHGNLYTILRGSDSINGFTLSSNGQQNVLVSNPAAVMSTLIIFCNNLGVGGTFQVQTSDGTNFYAIPAINVNTGVVSGTVSSTGVYQFNMAGMLSLWIKATSLTSGTISGNYITSPGLSGLTIINALPPGTNSIGAVTAAKATAAAPSYIEATAVNLSTDLSGALRVSGSFSASTAATVSASEPNYTEGSASNLSQSLTGQLRTYSYAKVSDAPESYLDGDIRPLSLNSEGRLRVATTPSPNYIDMFGTDFASVDSDDFCNLFDMVSNPWDGLNNKK